MNSVAPNLAAVYWALALLGSMVVALLSALLVWYWRFSELAKVVGSVHTTAEIYEKSQERIIQDHARSQETLLKTIQAIISQHAEMYRELSVRHSTLEERSTNHGQELRRLALNITDLRSEARTAVSEAAEKLHEAIIDLQKIHREDMARLQARRRGD